MVHFLKSIQSILKNSVCTPRLSRRGGRSGKASRLESLEQRSLLTTIVNTSFDSMPGNAVLVGQAVHYPQFSEIRLTENTPHQQGSLLVSYGARAVAFSGSAQVWIGNDDRGGDGMSIGYGSLSNSSFGERGTSSGVWLSIDTWEGDPYSGRVFIIYNGTIVDQSPFFNQTARATNGIAGRRWHDISWSMTESGFFQYTHPALGTRSAQLSGWGNAVQANWRFGMGARTGADFDEHAVNNLTIVDDTRAPTALNLSGTSVNENSSGATIGSLSTTDTGGSNSFTYSLVSGAGSTHNSSFQIVGSQLRTATGLNYEEGATRSVRVRTTDQAGMSFERAFTISVLNVNEAPTDISLTGTTVSENQPAGTTVGSLSSSDPDFGSTFTYSLVSGTGSTHNASFQIVGNSLRTSASLDFEAGSTRSIRIRSTDQGGLSYEKIFTITVQNVNEAPTNITLTDSSVTENQPIGTTIGTFSTVDPDAGGSFAYSLVEGVGDNDNGHFEIVNGILTTKTVFDFATKSSYTIRVRTMDQGGLSYERSFVISVVKTPQVLTVPLYQSNPEYPHQAHEGAHITLKAIIRDAEIGSTYHVAWDANRNGNFNDDFSTVYTTDSTTGSVRDIGRTFVVPDVAASQDFDINVRVTDGSSGAVQFGTFQLYVHDFRPSNDPRNWSTSQLDIIQELAVSESLWTLHRRMEGLSGSGSQISGKLSYQSAGGDDDGTASYLELLARTGHYPAYVPGSINDFGVPLPAGFTSANHARWSNDPYAESAARLLNYIAANATIVTGIDASDEPNTMGFNPDGTEKVVPRISGTTDGLGLDLRVGGLGIVYSVEISAQATSVEAFSLISSALGGTRLQVGASGVVGQTLEWAIQQGIDVLAASQIDTTAPNSDGQIGGNWSSNNNFTLNFGPFWGSDHNASAFAARALLTAHSLRAQVGVVVGNLHIYRYVDGLLGMRNNNNDGGFITHNFFSSSYDPSSIPATAAAVGFLRGIGVHNFNSLDATVAFPAYSTKTRAQLRTAYDQALSFLATQWTAVNKTQFGGWQDGYWQNGDYLLGNTNALYNAGAGGELYSFYHSVKGFGYVSGLNSIGPRNWEREFTTYLARAQSRSLSGSNPLLNYQNFGTLDQTLNFGTGYVHTFASLTGKSLIGGLSLLGTDQLPSPVAIINGPTTGLALEPLTFNAGNSFHPIPDRSLETYQWDVNASNGLWWQTGAAPDATGVSPTHSFSPGNHTITLRIVDNSTSALRDTATWPVSVSQTTPTIITSNGGGPTASVSLPEGTQFVTTVVGETSSPYVPISYSLDVTGDHAQFSINSSTGALSFTAAPDFEVPADTDGDNVYEIIVRARQLVVGEPIGDSQVLTITVTDVEEDVTAPVSAINVLPASSSSLLIPISVAGSDPGAGASGVQEYDLYYSTGGSFIKFATVPVSSPSTTFTGSANTTYWFRSLARDHAGNVESKISADTYTRIGDVVPPVTQVISATPNSSGLFTIEMTGSKASGSALTQFDVYVSVDSSAAVLIGTATGGMPTAGVYTGTVAFQGLADGASHTYRFYSIGRDGSGNVEAAPVSGDVSATYSFSPVAFSASGIDVQNGANQRSYVRYLDVFFSSAAELASWPAGTRVAVERFAIDATSVTPGSGTAVTGFGLTKDGSKLKLDFGSAGLGGLRQAGNGFYRILLDLDGNGSFADAGDRVFEFHRLFGDANGDGRVDVADTNLVTSQVGRRGTNLDGDLDGNGIVNTTDRLYSTQQRGKRLLDPLLGWLDD